MEGVTVAQVDSNRRPVTGTEKFVPCDTLLLSVGLIPENELTRAAGIPIDPVTNGALVDENCQTRISGIFACGNVLQVHDLVDYVSEEAERAGIGAVSHIFGKARSGKALTTAAGSGVRYVLPQSIHNRENDVTLFLRVTKPFGRVRLRICDGSKVLATVMRQRVAPGEMEKITLKSQLLQSAGAALSVDVEVLE